MSAFQFSIAFAAIDGLLSAFVALLILALAVIGQGESGTRGPDALPSNILLIEKSVADGGDAIGARLSLYVEPFQQHVDTIEQRYQIESVEFGESSTTTSAAGPEPTSDPMIHGGAIGWWRDCVDQKLKRCTSMLMVSRQPPGSKPWRIHMSITSSEYSLSPPIISVVVRVFGHERTETFQLHVGEEKSLCVDWNNSMLAPCPST